MKSNEKRKLYHAFIVFVLTLLLAFGTASSAMAESGAKNYKFNAMSRNLYLGADIFKVVNAAQMNPEMIPYVVAEVYQTMLFTNFWARAEAIADEIMTHKPLVIGLQEVSTFYKQTPGDFMIGNPEKATDVVIDFYEVLNDALLARGLVYEAFTVTNADVELPMVDPEADPPYYLSDVRMVDRDMVLVKQGYDAEVLLADNFTVNLALNLGGVDVEFTRGFLIVDVDISGQTFRFVNTHLEVRSAAGSVFRFVQDRQMQELTGQLAYYSAFDTIPIVMMGDFNSSPKDVPGQYYHPDLGGLDYIPPYMQAIEAGYLDTWLLQKKKYDEGYTSGFDEYVSDPSAELTSRIDLIFVDPKDMFIIKTKCEVVGNDVSDMIPNPIDPDTQKLWPSDHAGVVAEIQFLKMPPQSRGKPGVQ